MEISWGRALWRNFLGQSPDWYHTCGWWMSVSLTIVVMGLTPEFGNHNITVVAFRR